MNAQEIIDYIANSEKKTPVKVYVNLKEPVDFGGAAVFGEGLSHTVFGDWGELGPGDRISCTARVVSSDRAYGSETTYYTARGVYLLAYCKETPDVVPAQRVPIRYWPALCARKLHDGIYTAFDETAAPIAAAVTLGDKSGLDGPLHSAFGQSAESQVNTHSA